ACSHEDEACTEELVSLRQKHLDTAEQVTGEGPEREQLLQDIDHALRDLAQDVEALRQAAKAGQEMHLRTAAVASWGERLSILLVAAAACAIGIQTKPVKQEVIVTSHPCY